MKTEPTRIENFIDGEFTPPIGGRYLANIEPATGKPYSQLPIAERQISILPLPRRRKLSPTGQKHRPRKDRRSFCASPT